MTASISSRLAAALALAFPLTAFADLADLDIPGPNGRSSVTASVGVGSASYDVIQGNTVDAESRTNSRALFVGGTFAINDRVSIGADWGRALARESYTTGGITTRQTFAQNGGSIGIQARVVGSRTAPGFGLVLGAQAGHMEGNETAYNINVMPQVRFSPTLVGSVMLGATHADEVRATSLGVALSIKATPNFSVTPNIGWNRSRVDGAPSLTSNSAGVQLAYHFTNNLSLEGGIDATVWKDRSYGVGAGSFRIVDDVAVFSTVGIRWSF